MIDGNRNRNRNTPTYSDSSVNIATLITNNYVIICDTNVYLGLYRYSPDYANFALECLRAIQAHLVLPYTVKIEFNKHHQALFKRRKGKIENAVEDTLNLIENQRNKLKNSYSTLMTRHFPGADDLKVHIDNKYEELKDLFINYFDERSVLSLIQDTWTSDVVMKLIQELINNNQLMQDFTRDVIYQICTEGENRYKKEIPPGFEDGKKKDGIRKYSDLILWKEVIHYAQTQQKNVIFVTDDIKKEDWWINEDNIYEFLPHLVQEFERDTKLKASKEKGYLGTSMKIVPLVSVDFFESISASFHVSKSDAVDQALHITDKDYIEAIQDNAFNFIIDTLQFSGFNYIDETELSYVGTEEYDTWEIENYELSHFTMVKREDDLITYELTYDVEMSTSSYDYWGRDEDTKEVILSPAIRHGVKGQLTIRVIRTVDIFMDFEYSDEFDSAEILIGNFVETYHQTNFSDVEDVLNPCPDCGNEIYFENDGGNGFCRACAPNH